MLPSGPMDLAILPPKSERIIRVRIGKDGYGRMSKGKPIALGRRAMAALRDLLRRWRLGVGSRPPRRVTANGYGREACRACQIIAERRADAARIGARPQLGSNRGRVRVRE